MPVKYGIDKVAGIIHARAFGGLTDEDALTYQRGLEAHPDFDPSYREFFNFTGVGPFAMTSIGLRQLAQSSPWGKSAQRAFVAQGDLPFAMLRAYHSWLGSRAESVAVFRTTSEAWQWLAQTESHASTA